MGVGLGVVTPLRRNNTCEKAVAKPSGDQVVLREARGVEASRGRLSKTRGGDSRI